MVKMVVRFESVQKIVAISRYLSCVFYRFNYKLFLHCFKRDFSISLRKFYYLFVYLQPFLGLILTTTHSVAATAVAESPQGEFERRFQRLGISADASRGSTAQLYRVDKVTRKC
jgi:hypothetical protein